MISMTIEYLEESTPVMLRSLQKFVLAPAMELDGDLYDFMIISVLLLTFCCEHCLQGNDIIRISCWINVPWTCHLILRCKRTSYLWKPICGHTGQ
ncbi:hypothetical protein CRYUN_Cryun01aG0092400 [Craigia yunnanensis]